MCSASYAKETLKILNLEEGRNEDNSLLRPVFDGTKAEAVEVRPIMQGFAPGTPLVKLRKGTMGGWNGQVDPSFDFGALLRQALKQEGHSLGLSMAEGGWTIGGTMTDLYLVTHAQGFVVVNYAYMGVTLDVTAPDGQTHRRTFKIMLAEHGWKAKMKYMEAALAQVILEGAQDILVELNRSDFHAPPLPGIEDLVSKVTA